MSRNQKLLKIQKTYGSVLLAVLTGLMFSGNVFGEIAETGQLPAAETFVEEGLPETYRVSEKGKLPEVKNQGSLGTCWALSAVSAIEAALLPDIREYFSADHFSMQNGFHITQAEGGDYMMAMAYTSGWYGPVFAERDPYGDGYSPDGLTADAFVQEIRMLEGMGREKIKQFIFQYGPVQTSLYMDRKATAPSKDFYQEAACAYYYPESRSNIHDILIVGWDDDYSKDNFKLKPQNDGAWICQNTWGASFGEGGLFYVSYEDANIAKGGLAYTRVDAEPAYDRVYQTDVCGWQGQQGYEQETCYFANVYTAETEEDLKAVGFYATGADTYYEIYVVHDFENPESFAEKALNTCGWLADKGYYTIDLAQMEGLRRSERFAVVVKIQTAGAKNPVAVELHKDTYTDTVTLDGKEGYLSLYGEVWEYTEKKFQTNVCLKAYTSEKKIQCPFADGNITGADGSTPGY